MRDAAMNILRLELLPADFFRNEVEHSRIFRKSSISPCRTASDPVRGMRKLVHEALDTDRVVIDADTAPEARWHMRIVHRMVDLQIWNAVAERPRLC